MTSTLVGICMYICTTRGVAMQDPMLGYSSTRPSATKNELHTCTCKCIVDNRSISNDMKVTYVFAPSWFVRSALFEQECQWNQQGLGSLV